MAVGRMSHVTPEAEIMGRATVREHFPTQEMSLTAKTRMNVTSQVFILKLYIPTERM